MSNSFRAFENPIFHFLEIPEFLPHEFHGVITDICQIQLKGVDTYTSGAFSTGLLQPLLSSV